VKEQSGDFLDFLPGFKLLIHLSLNNKNVETTSGPTMSIKSILKAYPNLENSNFQALSLLSTFIKMKHMQQGHLISPKWKWDEVHLLLLQIKEQ
jgi:hypothetical protein